MEDYEIDEQVKKILAQRYPVLNVKPGDLLQFIDMHVVCVKQIHKVDGREAIEVEIVQSKNKNDKIGTTLYIANTPEFPVRAAFKKLNTNDPSELHPGHKPGYTLDEEWVPPSSIAPEIITNYEELYGEKQVERKLESLTTAEVSWTPGAGKLPPWVKVGAKLKIRVGTTEQEFKVTSLNAGARIHSAYFKGQQIHKLFKGASKSNPLSIYVEAV